jgi:hypothetical protein
VITTDGKKKQSKNQAKLSQSAHNNGLPWAVADAEMMAAVTVATVSSGVT